MGVDVCATEKRCKDVEYMNMYMHVSVCIYVYKYKSSFSVHVQKHTCMHMYL